MALLDGFEEFSFAKGLPTLTFTKNGAAFSKTAVLRLKKAPYAKVMINRQQLMIAIKPCGQGEENAVPFCSGKAEHISARINNSDFLSTIQKLTGWDLSKEIHKVQGEYHEEEGIMIFKLKENDAN